MFWVIAAFGFATLGSKILLAFGIVYAFLPDDPECARCDAETVRVQAPRGLRAVADWSAVQWRWCPRCGERCLARGGRPPRLWVGRRQPDRDGAPPVPSRAGPRAGV